MDGYKKFILFGCLILGGGYFLPWMGINDFTINGYSIVRDGLEILRPMYESGMYNNQILVTFIAFALPAAGAILSFLYCMLKPVGSNGLFGTLFFLLPFLSLLAVYGYVFSSMQSGSMPLSVLNELADAVQESMYDLRLTGGLWMVHVGAVLMLFGRLCKSDSRRTNSIQ